MYARITRRVRRSPSASSRFAQVRYGMSPSRPARDGAIAKLDQAGRGGPEGRFKKKRAKIALGPARLERLELTRPQPPGKTSPGA